MKMPLKIVIAVAAALVVGFVIGYALGHARLSDVESSLQLAKKQVGEADKNLQQANETCAQQQQAGRTSRQILLCKGELLQALVELSISNYGLTSQHLAQARSWLKAAEKGLKGGDAKRARELFDKIGDAQTLAMKLDAMARTHIEGILTELQKLPGAR
jgi:hypothetical protein